MATQSQADTIAKLRSDKALAIATFGEAVASYRYRVMAEKAILHEDSEVFREMADEEQEHKQRLEALNDELYPDSDFILAREDKALICAGPRLLEVRDRQSFRAAMRLLVQSEQRTASFYETLSHSVDEARLKDTFRELSEEGYDHAQRLAELRSQIAERLKEADDESD